VGAGQNKKLTSKSEGGVRSQTLRAGAWRIFELISWDCGQGTKLSCPKVLEEGLTSQRQSDFGAPQLLPSISRNIFDRLGESGSEKPQSSMQTYPVSRRDK
jgi:hypothetical protein